MGEVQPQPEVATSLATNTGVYIAAQANERLYQGGVLEAVVEWAIAYDETKRESVVGAQAISHQLVVVLSQDCDLEQDHRQRLNDNWIETDLRTILLCPAFAADDLRKKQNLSSRKWESVRQNKDDRYAYLAEIDPTSDSSGTGHPAILLDLTSCFTVQTPELYRQVRLTEAKQRCRIQTPWREHLQMRFANYLARIGLPRDHFIPESRRPTLAVPTQ